jgi:putative sterol carrier protein
MRSDAATFDALVTGRLDAMTAYLRGQIEAEGQIGMLEALQMLIRDQAAGSRENAT